MLIADAIETIYISFILFMISSMLIEVDGSEDEGGGQFLRTALTLSMCTGHSLHLRHIRAGRKNPGLMRQHLTAAQAAAAVCSAKVDGATAGSIQLRFLPNRIQSGDYCFRIGTAGSCTLILQTLLPALLTARQNSRITVGGGTHNSMSPPFHFLQRAFLPLLKQMGAQAAMELNCFGFYPKGGGSFTATELNLHASTNAAVICRFLPIAVKTDQTENGDIRVTLKPEPA